MVDIKKIEIGLGRLMTVEQTRGNDWRVYLHLDKTFDEGIIGDGGTPSAALESAWTTVRLLEQAIIKLIHSDT